MFILIFSLLNYKVYFYSGIGLKGYDFENRIDPSFNYLSLGKILFGNENLKIGTSFLYGNLRSQDLLTFIPVILSLEKRFNSIGTGFEITSSFWCRNHSQKMIEKFVNASLYGKIFLSKGLETKLVFGLNYEKLVETRIIPFFKWDFDFVTLEKKEYISYFGDEEFKRLFRKHLIQGGLYGTINIIMGNLLYDERIKDVKSFENYTILFISPVIGEGLGSLLMKQGLIYGEENNILDFITLGISEGLFSGFVSGFGFGALYDPLSDLPIDEKYNIGNMLGYGVVFSIFGGLSGILSGMINYFIAR